MMDCVHIQVWLTSEDHECHSSFTKWRKSGGSEVEGACEHPDQGFSSPSGRVFVSKYFTSLHITVLRCGFEVVTCVEHRLHFREALIGTLGTNLSVFQQALKLKFIIPLYTRGLNNWPRDWLQSSRAQVQLTPPCWKAKFLPVLPVTKGQEGSGTSQPHGLEGTWRSFDQVGSLVSLYQLRPDQNLYLVTVEVLSLLLSQGSAVLSCVY
jgi:hypothetical protein